MTTNLIIALGLFVAAMSCAGVAAFIYYYMSGMVSAKSEKKFAFIGIDLIKGGNLLREHKRLFPGSRLEQYLGLTFILMIIFYGAAAYFFFQ
jgi:hypothetical protein